MYRAESESTVPGLLTWLKVIEAHRVKKRHPRPRQLCHGSEVLAMSLPVVHVRHMETPMKDSGISSTEVVIALVLLGLCIAMFGFGVELRRVIQ